MSYLKKISGFFRTKSASRTRQDNLGAELSHRSFRLARRAVAAMLVTGTMSAGLVAVTTGVASASQQSNTVTIVITDNTANWSVANPGTPGTNTGLGFNYGDSVTISACSYTGGSGDQQLNIADGNGTFGAYAGVVSGQGCVAGYTFTANNTQFGDDWVASSGGNANIANVSSPWSGIYTVGNYSGPSLGNGGNTVVVYNGANFCLPFTGGNIGGDNWSASGAPPGMSWDGNNCYSGAPSSAGQWTGSISDTEYDGVGNPFSTTGYWTVTSESGPGSFTNASSTGFNEGQTGSFSFNAPGAYPDAATYVVSSGSLPAGVSLNSGGLLSGAATQSGSFGFTVEAYNSIGSSFQNFTLNVTYEGPGISNAAATTFTAGSSSSFDFSATGSPTPTWSTTTVLPSGLSLSSGGVLSGTPAIGTGGAYTVNIKATNEWGSDSQSFSLVIDQAVTGLTGPSATMNLSADTSGTQFTVASSTYPASVTYSIASGQLPTGVNLASDGTLSGAPLTGTSGSWKVRITAANSTGGQTASFTFTVSSDPAQTDQQSAGISSAIGATLNNPSGVATDSAGDLFIANTANNEVQMVPATAGTYFGQTMLANHVYTIAGTGTAGRSGYNSLAVNAELRAPDGVAVDSAGDLFIADTGNNQVLVVPAASGTILGNAVTANNLYIVAGNGTAGYVGDNGPATSASVELSGPDGVAVDSAGDLFIADTGNNVVREIASQSTQPVLGQAQIQGDIYTLVGGGSTAASDAGTADSSVTLSGPKSVAVSSSGNLFIADTGNSEIDIAPNVTGTYFNVSMSVGKTYIIGGSGVSGDYGEGSVATSAAITSPSGLALDSLGDVIFTDSGTGQVSEIAATNQSSFGLGNSNDGFLYGLETGVTNPVAVAIDPSSALYVATSSGNEVQLFGNTPAFTPGTGQQTVATTTSFANGSSNSYSFAASGAPAATFTVSGTLPAGVTLSSNGTLSGTPAQAGTYPITVRASNLINGATLGFSLVVNPEVTLTTLSASPVAPVVDGTTVLTATVSPVPDGGTVQFTDALAGGGGTGYISGCSAVPVTLTGLASGTATCTTGQITSVQQDNVSALYSGDTNYGSSSATPISIFPTASPTTVSVIASPGSPAMGSTTVLTATVSPVPDGGTVQFSDTQGAIGAGGAQSCSAVPVATTGIHAGTATCTTGDFPVGPTGTYSDELDVSYSGNSDYQASDNSAAPQSLTTSLATTSLSISLSPSQPAFNSPVTVTATVTGGSSTPGITGTIGLTDTDGDISGCGSLTLPSSPGTGTNSVSCQVANWTTPAGTADSIFGSYSGDSNYLTSLASLGAQVGKSTTTLSLSTSSADTIVPDSIVQGDKVTLAALVTPPPDGGTVAFSDAGGWISGCSTQPVINGTATCVVPASTTSNMTGSHDQVMVAYSGDSNYTAIANGSGQPVSIDAIPAITTASSAVTVAGTTFNFVVQATGTPAVNSIIENGNLPQGIHVTSNSNGTATLSGTASATAGGIYPIAFIAQNGVTSQSPAQSFMLQVDASPAMSSAATANFTETVSGSFLITTTGYPSARITGAGPLPTGLAFVDNGNGSATLSGVPAVGTAGVSTLVVSASNGVASGVSQTLQISIAPAPPPAPTPNQGNGGGGITPNNGNSSTKPPTPETVSFLGHIGGAEKSAISQKIAPTAVKKIVDGKFLESVTASFGYTDAKHHTGSIFIKIQRDDPKVPKVVRGKKVQKSVVFYAGDFVVEDPGEHIKLTFHKLSDVRYRNGVVSGKASTTVRVHKKKKNVTFNFSIS